MENTLSDSKTYILSDTHLFHNRIIEYEKRPFISVEEMNETIVNNWNGVVRSVDKVIHLGDVVFGTVEQAEIIKRLFGYKVLVKGNHDRSLIRMRNLGFQEAHNNLILETPLGKVLCSHKPVKTPTLINFHGHMHSAYKFHSEKNYKWINFSVENWNYTPVLLEDACIKFQEWYIQPNQ